MTLYQYMFVIIEPCMAIFCIVAAVYAILTRNADPRSAKLIFFALLAGALFNTADTLATYFNGDATQTGFFMVRISNLISYISGFLLFIFEIEYLWRRTELRGGKKNKNLRIAGLFICTAGIFVVIMSRFFGFYYTFDSQNHYIKADYYWAHMIFAVLVTLIMLIQTITNRKAFMRREYNSFLVLSLLPALSLFIQLLIPWDISVYIIGVTFSILTIFAVYRRDASDLSMVRESLNFTGRNIDLVSGEVEKFLVSLEMEKRNRMRLRLTIEEVLLRMREKFGEDEKFDLLGIINFGKPQIIIEKKGKLFNPLHASEDDPEEVGTELLASVGINPLFSYSSGRNIVKFPLPRRQMNPALKMMVSLIIGIIAGFIGMKCLSVPTRQMLIEDILRPVYGMMQDLLYCVSGPILFFMVIAAILDMSGIAEQGGNSMRITGRYFVLSFLVGSIAILSEIGYMEGTSRIDALNSSDLKTMFDSILSVIPKNVFDPFKQANTPQLLLMAIVIGLAVTALGSKAAQLSNGLKQANMLGMKLANWTGGIIPYFAVAMAAILYMSGRFDEILYLVPIIMASVVISLICMCAVLLYICVKLRVGPSNIVRKCLPSFITAFRKGSLDASLGQAEYCCTNGLGIDTHFTTSGLNAGLVLYMPVNVIGTLLFILHAAVLSNVNPSVLWLIVSVALAVMLFVATPPIPGANFLAYIAMMPVIGINNDYLMTALIFEIIFGIFASAANQFLVQMELILQSSKIGLLNEDILRETPSPEVK